MCELLAYSAKKPHTVNTILKSFFSHSPNHPHGWGLAVFREDKSIILKEPIKAINSSYLNRQLKWPLKSKNVLSHIRYATIGDIVMENTHPFTRLDISGREWILIHNGTVCNDTLIVPYEKVQNGSTDSERILLYLIDLINEAIKDKGTPLTSSERFRIVNELISDLAEGNKLNLMIFDEEQLYVHANGKNQMYYYPTQDGIIICTTPLDIESFTSEWKILPIMQTHCFKDGELILSGENHGHEYIPDPEIEKLLYLHYASL